MLGVGRFAALHDAQGAAFAAITSARKPEPENDPKPLEFSWHELTTDDWKAAEAFYRAPFGWKKRSKPDQLAGTRTPSSTNCGVRLLS